MMGRYQSVLQEGHWFLSIMERIIRHEQCLYNPTYSNICEWAQDAPNYVMNADGPKVEIKVGRKILYKIEKDESGMWIKPENG